MWLSLKIAKKPLVFQDHHFPYTKSTIWIHFHQSDAKPSHGDLKGWPGLGPGATCLGGPKRRYPNAFHGWLFPGSFIGGESFDPKKGDLPFL